MARFAPKSATDGYAHLSQLLRELLASGDTAPISVGELVDHFQERGLAAILAILALPIALPIPLPGISAVFGLPMLLISLQVVGGKNRLWLPASFRARTIDAARFQVAGSAAVAWSIRLEKILKPRLSALCHPFMQRVYGLICALLALILFLPVPFGNVLPSLSILMLAVALLERDGIAAGAGLVLSAVSVLVAGGAAIAAIVGIGAVLRRYLGG